MQTIKKHLDMNYEQIKLRVIANLLRLLVDIYGDLKAKENLSKIEGEEILFRFPALNGALVVKPHAGRLIAMVGESESPIATINFKVEDTKIYDTIEDIIKSSGYWGILKFIFKYVLRRKVGIGGSLRALIKIFKVLGIGNHEMYKRAKEKMNSGWN
ncbi:MAG: hypothetical protein ACTSYB_05155 [Candidatus Helarchaeota archaeon]